MLIFLLLVFCFLVIIGLGVWTAFHSSNSWIGIGIITTGLGEGAIIISALKKNNKKQNPQKKND